MNLVESKDVILDEKCSYQYISVIDTLKSILKNDDIWDEVNRVNHANYMTDFADGDYFQDHPIIKGSNTYLRIHLYTDEFEVVNPLGSKRTIHKLAAFYFIISNIRPKYRSKLKHIYLSILCKYSLIKKYTYNKILEPLIKEFNILKNEGFTITKDGKPYTIKAILCTVSSDNLSAHSIGGFSGSFSSGRIYRHCMALYSDIKIKFKESDYVLRNFKTHIDQVNAITCNQSLPISTYGVNSASPFLDLQYFDVTTCLPPDPMHDILEGIIPIILKILIVKFKYKLI